MPRYCGKPLAGISNGAHMPRHKMTEKHFAVLLAVQDGTTDFGPNVAPDHHAAAPG